MNFNNLPENVKTIIQEILNLDADTSLSEVKTLLEKSATEGHLKCINSDGGDEGWWGMQEEQRALNALKALEPYL